MDTRRVSTPRILCPARQAVGRRLA
jgi:hypothetical protein